MTTREPKIQSTYSELNRRIEFWAIRLSSRMLFFNLSDIAGEFFCYVFFLGGEGEDVGAEDTPILIFFQKLPPFNG